MKQTFFLFLLLNSINSFSQTIDSTNGYSMTEVVTSSLNNTELYNKAKEWIALNFKSANNVIQADIPNEKIIVKGISNNTIHQEINNTTFNTPYPIDLTITFDFKNLKYKYKIESKITINDTSYSHISNVMDSIWNVTPGSGLVGKKMREKVKKNQISVTLQQNTILQNEIQNTASSIKSGMIKKKEDNW